MSARTRVDGWQRPQGASIVSTAARTQGMERSGNHVMSRSDCTRTSTAVDAATVVVGSSTSRGMNEPWCRSAFHAGVAGRERAPGRRELWESGPEWMWVWACVWDCICANVCAWGCMPEWPNGWAWVLECGLRGDCSSVGGVLVCEAGWAGCPADMVRQPSSFEDGYETTYAVVGCRWTETTSSSAHLADCRSPNDDALKDTGRLGTAP